MENQSSLTALMSSFGRVYHAENDTPIIFNDTLSRQLMTDDEYQQIYKYMLRGIDFFAPNKKADFASADDMIKWIIQTQIAPTPLARARYCEDALKTAILAGTTQYVILGAGMDTFGFRNSDMLNNLDVFEVDHPLTQEEKQKRICRAGWKVPKGLSLSEQIESMMKALSDFSAKGSSILFDYATEDLFNSPIKRVQNMVAMAAASGEPMKSCFNYNNLERMLGKYHFSICEHLCTEEIQKRFFANRTDYLSAFEHIEYALAVLL